MAQDYTLKQITASVLYPEESIGKEFWDKVSQEAQKEYGTTDIPIDTFNKVWIVPDKAVIYENKTASYIVESRLKVMLEEDYLALQKTAVSHNSLQEFVQNKIDTAGTNTLGSKIIRQIVIPILEKEVNEGQNFIQLRQIYHSLILAIWLKNKFRNNIFGKNYIDKNKIAGVDVADKTIKDKIWGQYVESFKKGVYNFIKEDFNPQTQQSVPKKYFAGGVGFGRINLTTSPQLPENFHDNFVVESIRFNSTPNKSSSTAVGSDNTDLKHIDPNESQNTQADNIASAIIRHSLDTKMTPSTGAPPQDTNVAAKTLEIINSIMSEQYLPENTTILQKRIDALNLNLLSLDDHARLLDKIDQNITWIRNTVSLNLEKATLPRTVAAHEFTAVTPLTREEQLSTTSYYQRIGLLQYISNHLLLAITQKDIQTLSIVPGLNYDLVIKALRTGRIEPSDMPQAVQRFLEFLRRNNLDNVILVGGGVRDIFFGKNPDDFDVGIAIESFDHEERGIASFTRNEASERIWQIAQDSLARLAQGLNTEPIYLLRTNDPNAAKFEGREVQWAGPLKIFASAVTLRQMIAERGTNDRIGEFYPSSSGPSNLRVGIDASGRVYGLRGLLNYALGRVVIDGDGYNFTMGAVLRSLRLYLGFGLQLDDSVKTYIMQSMNSYIDGITPIGDNDFNIAQGLLGKILKDIGADPSKQKKLNELVSELKIDQVFLLLKAHHESHMEIVNLENINQENLHVFYNRINVRQNPVEWGLNFNSYADNYFSKEFREDITTQNAQSVEIQIGEQPLDRSYLEHNGWSVKQIFLNRGIDNRRADLSNPQLYRLEKAGQIQYVFGGIITPFHLYQVMAALKIFSYPISKIKITNEKLFDLKEYYQKELNGRFNGIQSVILALNIFVEPLVTALKQNGWSVTEDKTALGYSYLRLSKDTEEILIAYLNPMEGQATTIFADVLYDQGIRNFFFWGIAGALNPDLKYMDSIQPQKVFHADDPKIYNAPENLKKTKNVTLSGNIVDVHTPFAETLPVLRNYSQMGIAAVEMELFWLFQWLDQMKDPSVQMDVFLNISEILSLTVKPVKNPQTAIAPDKPKIFQEKAREQAEIIANSIPAISAQKGGIDLTQTQRHVYVTNTTNENLFNFDPRIIKELQNADGFTPIILNVEPIMPATIPLFLGAKNNSSSTTKSLPF